MPKPPPDPAPKPPARPEPKPEVTPPPAQKPGETGGPKGPEPTRYGDWEIKGRVSDF